MIDIVPTIIRTATNNDIPQVQNLIFGVLMEYGLKPDPDGIDSDLKDVEANYDGGMFNVIEAADGSIIGTVGLFPLNKEACELRKMYLAKSARGLGLGKKLLDKALAEAKALGFKTVELETASALQEAINLYKRYGFKKLDKAHLASRCDQAYVLELTE